jgi:ligand-binding sensor domain-containing protein
LSRYDGAGFVTYTTADGLVNNSVRSLLEDRAGHLWIGTWGGLSRYDGERFVTYTTQDGLADNRVLSLLEDGSGHLWIGTWGDGVALHAQRRAPLQAG